MNEDEPITATRLATMRLHTAVAMAELDRIRQRLKNRLAQEMVDAAKLCTSAPYIYIDDDGVALANALQKEGDK